jgi:flagellin-like hook-associated protein FlgL
MATNKLTMVLNKLDSKNMVSKLTLFVAEVKACVNTNVLEYINNMSGDVDIVKCDMIDFARIITQSTRLESEIATKRSALGSGSESVAFIGNGVNTLGELLDILNYCETLCIEAANETKTSTDRIQMAEEYLSLVYEVQNIAKNSEYNSVSILDNQSSKSTQDDRFEFAVDTAYGSGLKTKTVFWQQNVSWDDGIDGAVKAMNVYQFLMRPDQIIDNSQSTGSRSFTADNGHTVTNANWGASNGSGCFNTVAKAEAELTVIRRVQDSLTNIKNDGLVAIKRIKASIDVSTKALVTLQQGLDNAIQNAVTDVLKQLMDALSYHETRLTLYDEVLRL